MNKQELTTLSELAKDRNCLKSKLLYYTKLGIINPSEVKGKTFLFNKEKTVKILNLLEEKIKEGYGLQEIKYKILPTL